MAAYHDNAILNAEKTLGLGKSLMYKMSSKEQAHKEYMALKRALQKRLASGNVSIALKMLDISRAGSNVILTMCEGGINFPAPIYLDDQQAECQMVQSRQNTEGGDSINRIRITMLEDIAIGEEEKIKEFLGLFGEFTDNDKQKILLENAEFNLEVLKC